MLGTLFTVDHKVQTKEDFQIVGQLESTGDIKGGTVVVVVSSKEIADKFEVGYQYVISLKEIVGDSN